jgi:hypothetical protein
VKRLGLLALVVAGAAWLPGSAEAATCADYSNQAAAQQAADTRDADGDGIYCESLPCPCSTGAGGAAPPSRAKPKPTTRPRRDATSPIGCIKPTSVQPIGFSSTKYPNIRAHALAAIKDGWPRVLVVSDGVDARRDRLLQGFPTKRGYDRDEYPPAVGRGRGKYLSRGVNPVRWLADVAYVPSSENRSHGSTLGIKLRRFCNGTRFRYVFY